MKHEDLSTSEPPQSRAGFGLKTTTERSPKTEFWVQWFCPYTPLECNPFTYTQWEEQQLLLDFRVSTKVKQNSFQMGNSSQMGKRH